MSAIASLLRETVTDSESLKKSQHSLIEFML
jgi:hypothetical protein